MPAPEPDRGEVGGGPDRAEPADRIEAAALAFVVVAVAGYAFHRLGFKIAGEPDPRTIIRSEHVGFYWRVGTSAWWAAIAAFLASRRPGAARWLRPLLLPALVAGVVVAFAAA